LPFPTSFHDFSSQTPSPLSLFPEKRSMNKHGGSNVRRGGQPAAPPWRSKNYSVFKILLHILISFFTPSSILSLFFRKKLLKSEDLRITKIEKLPLPFELWSGFGIAYKGLDSLDFCLLLEIPVRIWVRVVLGFEFLKIYG